MVKVNVMVLMATCTIALYSMDNVQQMVEYKAGNTIIRVEKGHISKASGQVNLMVLGRNGQQLLREPASDDSVWVGDIYSRKDKTIRIRSKEDESKSDDDTYKPYALNCGNDWYKRANLVTVDSNVIEIVDPRVSKLNGQLCYVSETPSDILNCSSYVELVGNQSAQKAANDLKVCYDLALTYAMRNYPKNNCVALSALGTDAGVPRESAAPIAIKTILEFIRTNPNAFSLVYLFVKKRSEFDLYKKLFDEKLMRNLTAPMLLW